MTSSKSVTKPSPPTPTPTLQQATFPICAVHPPTPDCTTTWPPSSRHRLLPLKDPMSADRAVAPVPLLAHPSGNTQSQLTGWKWGRPCQADVTHGLGQSRVLRSGRQGAQDGGNRWTPLHASPDFCSVLLSSNWNWPVQVTSLGVATGTWSCSTTFGCGPTTPRSGQWYLKVDYRNSPFQADDWWQVGPQGTTWAPWETWPWPPATEVSHQSSARGWLSSQNTQYW